MDKEEIIKRRVAPQQIVLPAMDEYAKLKSIGFAEWIAINGWYFNKIKRWSNRNEDSDNLILVIAGTKSTEELYSLYLTQQK
jgi:hypothetical protein